MTIKFLCPNGHPLTAPENLAGKAGKCPKCGLAFVVPTLEELGAAPVEPPPSEPEPPPAGSGTFDLEAPPSETGSSPKVGSGLFVFLCPNGHKLNGPPSLKGKAGQCPHCGARFRIPSDEDLAADADGLPPPDEEAPEYIPEEAAEPSHSSVDAYGQPLAAEPEIIEPEAEIYVDPPPETGHPLGYIFSRLWDQRTEGCEVELLLKEGEIFQPDFYCDNLSCREYGVFALEES